MKKTTNSKKVKGAKSCKCSPRVRNSKVKAFASKGESLFDELLTFVKAKCHSTKERESFLNDLCCLVDKYIDLNSSMLLWCHENGVDPNEFFCDVMNSTGSGKVSIDDVLKGGSRKGRK